MKLHLPTKFLAGDEPLESIFELPKGWALKATKNMWWQSYVCTNYKFIRRFLLAGEAETMLEELNVMAEEGQVDKNEVPKLREWITSYAAVFKKKNAKKKLVFQFK